MGTKDDVLGFTIIDSLIKAIRSIPEAPLVLYSGNFTKGSGSENSPLKRWYERYNQYKSADARNLADGMFDFYLSSGVDLDTVEKGEYEALIKKHGQDKVSGRALQYIDEMPITSAMLNDFRKIMGSVDEETVEKESKERHGTCGIVTYGSISFLRIIRETCEFFSHGNCGE